MDIIVEKFRETEGFVHNSRYLRIYLDIMKRGMNRIRKTNDNHESHHIIPRSLGGPDERWNISVLTHREHYIAHLILAKKLTKDRAKASTGFALYCMTRGRSNKCSRDYSLAKKSRSEALLYMYENSDLSERIQETRRKNGNTVSSYESYLKGAQTRRETGVGFTKELPHSEETMKRKIEVQKRNDSIKKILRTEDPEILRSLKGMRRCDYRRKMNELASKYGFEQARNVW